MKLHKHRGYVMHPISAKHNASQLKQGIKIEMEHAHLFPKNLRKYMAEKIAKDHLKEDAKYYTKLKKRRL